MSALALYAFALLGFSIIPLFVGAVAVVGFLLASVVHALFRSWVKARLHLAKTGLYLLLLVASGFTHAHYADLSRERALALISACEAYRHRYGAYPSALTSLVPEFVTDVRAARPALWGAKRFHYRRHRGEFELGYMSAPMVLQIYSSWDGRWRVRD